MHVCTFPSLWMPQPLFLSALYCWKSLVVSRDLQFHAFLSIPFYLLAWCQAYGSMAKWEWESLCHCGTILYQWLTYILPEVDVRQNTSLLSHRLLAKSELGRSLSSSLKSWFPSSFALLQFQFVGSHWELPSLLGFLLTYWEILI